ncbi:hypothetical protein [Zymobacter sp. IVIA_12111.31 C1]|uniref:hypothetical protein n=1 Tax=Zymobacter sp. IVIA_12111.31 C1 TaxID=3394854 RepID=UPI0039C1BC26
MNAAARCPLPAARCPLPAARCPLPAARCPLPAARCPLPAARCLWARWRYATVEMSTPMSEKTRMKEGNGIRESLPR